MLLAEDNLAPLNLVAEGLQEFLQVQFPSFLNLGGNPAASPLSTLSLAMSPDVLP